ncbi:Ig-like domain-containing protein [Vibrio gangliei]|uniref:Ig-like domain-containing protein n=1 Tax=Vibrio gangliei TaxID=2077090 RepID=UPI000D019FED|nr:Ig-like domain-containing protein [Vibrio gangliei]
MMKNKFITLISIFMILFISGCKNNGDTGLLENPDSGADNNIQQLVISPENSSIVTGGSQTYTAAIFQGGTFVSDVTKDADWASSDADNVSFDEPGVAKSNYEGEVTITAKYNGLTSNTSTLTISDKTVASIEIVPIEKSTLVGMTANFIAMANFMEGGREDVSSMGTWDVENDSIASVDNKGEVTPLSVGDSQINFTYSGISVSAQLHVVGDITEVDSLTITPKQILMTLGDRVGFNANLHLITGETVHVTDSVEWSSSLPGTMIDQSGIFISQVEGQNA